MMGGLTIKALAKSVGPESMVKNGGDVIICICRLMRKRTETVTKKVNAAEDAGLFTHNI